MALSDETRRWANQRIDEALDETRGRATQLIDELLDLVRADAVQAERAAAAAYVRDRARWLRAEADAGGSMLLRKEAKTCDYIADQIEAGRRAGSHLR